MKSSIRLRYGWIGRPSHCKLLKEKIGYRLRKGRPNDLYDRASFYPMQYKVIADSDLGTFNASVKAALDEGFVLYGNPFQRKDEFAQAVTKDEKASSREPTRPVYIR